MKSECEETTFKDGQTLESLLKSLGMWGVTQGVMWVLQEIFHLEQDKLIADPQECEGRMILKNIMLGGNFGVFDPRLNRKKEIGRLSAIIPMLQHNTHLLGNYPADIIWTPVWVAWHWLCKRTLKVNR